MQTAEALHLTKATHTFIIFFSDQPAGWLKKKYPTPPSTHSSWMWEYSQCAIVKASCHQNTTISASSYSQRYWLIRKMAEFQSMYDQLKSWYI